MEQRITYLLQKRMEQSLTAAEAEELLGILQQTEYDEVVTDHLQQMAVSQEPGPVPDQVALQRWVHEITAIDRQEERSNGDEVGRAAKRKPAIVRTVWLRYAAAILIVIGIGGYLFYHQRSQDGMFVRSELAQAANIAPGGNIALLTLSDGSKIALDSVGNGLLSKQGNTKVVKSGSGQLSYSSGSEAAAATVIYNSITTPRGGQYQVLLPDGTKVWLNASSSLHFPTAFHGKERVVDITGEAYFEIAKDAGKPFYVRANGQSVEVLGTHFNINAYSDEPVFKTTLLEGSIRVLQGGDAVLLSPGQQAQIVNAPGGQRIKVAGDADLEEAIAWKNGSFHLASADIATIMRQVARWYDVEVVFEGGMPSGHITGDVPRNTSLLKVLQVFETSGIHFRVGDRKIIVTP